jgi:hypothetical protein
MGTIISLLAFLISVMSENTANSRNWSFVTSPIIAIEIDECLRASDLCFFY